MSIEAMKRIKSLLQDTDKIDSHTISAVVAECDAVILAQQPVTGEPVAWIRRHPNGALSNELLIHVQVEQVRRDSGAWVPLYTHPAPGVPDDVVRDAERGRFLLEWLERRGLLQAEFGQIGVGEKPENWWLLHAPWGIDKTRPFFGHGKTPEQAIDAAMLAAK